MMAKVKDRLAVSKQTTQKSRMDRFSIKKLKEMEGKKQHRVEISNRYAASKILDDDDVNINRASETI
jgi:hypothetical protein